jgi:hypothetical protein
LKGAKEAEKANAEKANAEKANAVPRSKLLGPTKIERIKAPHITEANLTAYGFQATKTDHKEEQKNTKDTCIYIYTHCIRNIHSQLTCACLRLTVFPVQDFPIKNSAARDELEKC